MKSRRRPGSRPPPRPRRKARRRRGRPNRPSPAWTAIVRPVCSTARSRRSFPTPSAARSGIRARATPDRGQLYGLQLPLLIGDWRTRWGQGDFPFAWVQLPNFHAPQQEPVEDGGWVLVQEAMLKTLRVPNTGMAITIDMGEANNIHPVNKQEVGRRLALWALAKVYGQDGALLGTDPQRGTRSRAARSSSRCENCDGGLMAKGGELKGFAIAGADKKWVKAKAKISGDTVVVSSPAGAAAGGRPLRLGRQPGLQPVQRRRPARIALPHRRLAVQCRGAQAVVLLFAGTPSAIRVEVERTSCFLVVDLVGCRGSTNWKGLLRGGDYPLLIAEEGTGLLVYFPRLSHFSSAALRRE